MNVCVVGNGPSAIKKKNAKFIDQCDRVIRMGNFQTDGYSKYIGSKTDIYISRWKKLEGNFDRVSNLDVWLAYPSPPHDWCSHYSREESIYRNSLAIRGLDITYIPTQIQTLYKTIYKPYNNVFARSSDKRCGFNIPDTGMVAIDMAKFIYTEAKIFVTGIDGYFLESDYYYNRGVQINIDYTNESPLLQQFIRFNRLVARQEIFIL